MRYFYVDLCLFKSFFDSYCKLGIGEFHEVLENIGLNDGMVYSEKCSHVIPCLLNSYYFASQE